MFRTPPTMPGADRSAPIDRADPTDGTDPTDLAERHLERVRRRLLQASAALWRDLPWRTTRDPWHVLVSEVMLQQTQVPRVVAPFRSFVDRFPTPATCAAAGLAEIVRAWAGLGYNRRAVNLHRSATIVVERHGGRVPEDLEALLALPGVGPYTARAVLAFAFEHPVGVVDTNVKRVLARAVAGRTLEEEEAQQLADQLVPREAAWRFNQALFDLGAQFCTARVPRCRSCPISSPCLWARHAAGDGQTVEDPAGVRRRQQRFSGSDREGRGRLVEALRLSPVPEPAVAAAAGWPDDGPRARRIAQRLVEEGLACWDEGSLALA